MQLVSCVVFFLLVCFSFTEAGPHQKFKFHELSYEYHPLELLVSSKVTVDLDPQISISVSKTNLTYSDESIVVSWTVPIPSKQDWIASYSPASYAGTDSLPIKFIWASFSPNYLTNGTGSYSLNIVNMREDYVLALMRNGTEYPILSALSPVIRFKNYNEPLEPHLALTSFPNSLSLSWSTKTHVNPYVKYGTIPGKYMFEASADTTAYTKKDMCGGLATNQGWRNPGETHTAQLTNLIPQTKYYYIFGDEHFGFSSEFSFIAPLPSPHSDYMATEDLTSTVVIYGDMGQAPVDGWEDSNFMQPAALNTTKMILSDIDNINLILHIGDIGYALGISSLWDEFFKLITPLASKVPYMTAVGNHEVDWPDTSSIWTVSDSHGECGVPYQNRFKMLNSDSKTYWYSFDYGYAHYMVISTEHNFTEGSDQYNFVLNDLSKVDRSITPWLIVVGHRPQYIDSTNNAYAGDQPVAQLLRTAFDPLFAKFKVDVAFWGHHHSYQRTCVVNNEVCSSNGTVHVVVGAAGAGFSTNFEKTPPVWAEFLECTYHGFGKMTISKNSLMFLFISDDEGDVRDKFVLYK